MNCRAIFGLLQSPVLALQFASKGAKLAVGYECGRVSTFDYCIIILVDLMVIFTNTDIWCQQLILLFQVAVIDTSSLSVSFLADCLSQPSSPVLALTWETLRQTDDHIKSPRNSESKIVGKIVELSLYALTKDAKIYVINGGIGSLISPKPLHLDSTVISMYVIGKYEFQREVWYT